MSERSPATNFKFGFSFPEPEAELELEADSYDNELVEDIKKAEVMAYAGRNYEEAAVLYRKLATEAILQIGKFEPGMSSDHSFLDHHAHHYTIKSDHYTKHAEMCASKAKIVYLNASNLYDRIQATKTDGLVYDFEDYDPDDDFDPVDEAQMELPLEIGEEITETPEELPNEPFETPAAA